MAKKTLKDIKIIELTAENKWLRGKVEEMLFQARKERRHAQAK